MRNGRFSSRRERAMKILIAYAGRHGTTKECVERLASFFEGRDLHVADLSKETPDASQFDICLVGASVRFGRLQKEARAFLKKQEEALCEKHLGLFFCCGLPHESEYYRDVLFSKRLKQQAFERLYFGGSLRQDGLSGWEKLLIGSIRSAIAENEFEDGEYTPSLPGILPENIERMAMRVRREFLALNG